MRTKAVRRLVFFVASHQKLAKASTVCSIERGVYDRIEERVEVLHPFDGLIARHVHLVAWVDRKDHHDREERHPTDNKRADDDGDGFGRLNVLCEVAPDATGLADRHEVDPGVQDHHDQERHDKAHADDAQAVRLLLHPRKRPEHRENRGVEPDPGNHGNRAPGGEALSVRVRRRNGEVPIKADGDQVHNGRRAE